MKKIATILLVSLVVGFMGSCKPKEKCPAYGKSTYKHVKHSS